MIPPQLLVEHKILSVPVLDKSLGSPRYTAFVDVIDIVVHVVSKLKQEDIIGSGVPSLFSKFTAADLIGKIPS